MSTVTASSTMAEIITSGVSTGSTIMLFAASIGTAVLVIALVGTFLTQHVLLMLTDVFGVAPPSDRESQIKVKVLGPVALGIVSFVAGGMEAHRWGQSNRDLGLPELEGFSGADMAFVAAKGLVAAIFIAIIFSGGIRLCLLFVGKRPTASRAAQEHSAKQPTTSNAPVSESVPAPS